MASKQTRREIYITCNGKSADDMIKVLTGHLNDLNARLAQLRANGQGETKEAKQLASVAKQLSKQLKENVSDTQLIDKAMQNLAGSSTKQLRAALQAVRREMERTSEEGGKLPQLRKQFEQLKAQIDKNTGAVHKQSSAWQTAMKNLTAYVGLFGAFNFVKQKLTDILTLNFKYSDSLANVRKVSNLSMESVNEMSRQLAKIDSRTSLEGLTQLAYVGSRMGMGKYGAQGLAEFAAASDRVNVALKEDLGDDAMLTLSKFVETMGEVEKHGGNIGESFDAVSSSIFKLASTSTANGGNILEFAKRLTGLSKVSHITSDQLLGLASASDSLMLMPEVASTAFGKLISSLWTNYHEIEKMLGMQEDSLKDMMSKGETMQALVKVLENVSDKNLNSMDEYFKEFGSDGQRLKSVVVTMAQNVGVLKNHLNESSRAYEDATAVSKEYAIQQETAQAIIERANNMWNKAFVNPEGIDAVKEMAKAWYDFSKTLTQSQPFLLSVKILMWELKASLIMLLNILPGLVAYMGTRGLVLAFSKLLPLMIGVSGSGVVKFFTLLTKAVMGNSAAVRLLHIRWTAMNLAMKANVIGLVVSAIATLGTWIYSLAKNTDNATKSMERFDSSFDGVRSKANQAVGELDAYYRAILRAKKGSLEYQAAVKVYNDKFGVYFKKLEKENGMVKDLAASYREAAKAIRAKMYLQLEQEDRDKFVKPRVGRALDRLAEYDQVAPKGFGREMLEAYTKDSYGKDMNVVIKELANRFGVKDVSNVLESERRGLNKAVRREKIRKYTLFGDPYTVYEDRDVPQNEQQLFSALRYVRQERAANNADIAVNRKFKPVRNETDAYLLSLNENEDLNVPDDGKTGKTGHNGGGRDNDSKKEEQMAKTRANALVSNIKAFYEEQKRKYLEWVTQMNADGERISEGQQKQQLDYIDTQMNKALGTARQSIATLDKGWEDFLKAMSNDVMVKSDETSKALLESIGKSDIKELHVLFEKLSGDLSKENNQSLSENLGALLDQIFANGSKELREAAEKMLAQQREIQKILNENDYTGAVNRTTRSNWDTLGLLPPAKGLKADNAEGLDKMNKAFDKLTEKARSSVAALYELNPASDTFKKDFLAYLSVANEGFDFSNFSVQKLKALYIELIKYTDNYTEAEKRKYNTAKKISDQMWAVNKRNLANQAQLRKMQEGSNLFGKRTNYLSNLGLKDLTADPEVELMKARMQAAEDYYAFIEKNYRNKQLLQEADTARQEAELAYANQMATSMKSRLSQMKELVQPIESFGEAVGSALADMKNDAESANEAIKSALKSMIESWGKMAINSVNTQMWKAINDAGAKRGKANAQPGIDAARANANADSSLTNAATIGTAGNPAHVIVEAMPLTSLGKDDGDGDPTGVIVGNGGLGDSTATSPSANTPGADGTANIRGKQQGGNHGGAAVSSDGATGVASAAGDAITSAATGGNLMDAAVGIAGSSANALMTTEFKKRSKSADANGDGGTDKASDKAQKKAERKAERQRKKELREEKKHQKQLSKETKSGVKEREKAVDSGVSAITKTTTENNNEQSRNTQIAQDTILNATDAAMNATLIKKQQNNQAQVQSDADRTQAEVTFSIAGAMAKCFEFLGPIAGPIAAAVVMSTLMGLLQWALSKAFSSKSDSSSSTSGPNTKLVSGMLTYDSGNVQDLKPFVGDDGEVYWASEQAQSPNGVSLLTKPTATSVNGRPSLVAEKGPEIVIGRETTQAMMMNNPSLLKALVNYDANYSGRRTYDSGNVGEVIGLSASSTAANGLIADNMASNAALMQAINVLVARLNEPINASINMYGSGNLYESMAKADRFMKGKR